MTQIPPVSVSPGEMEWVWISRGQEPSGTVDNGSATLQEPFLLTGTGLKHHDTRQHLKPR